MNSPAHKRKGALHPNGNPWLKGFYAFLIFLFAIITIASVCAIFTPT